MEQLFRNEVIEHKEHQWMGTVMLRRPVPMRLAAAAALCMLAAFTYLFFFQEVSRSVTVEGKLAASPDLITITAPYYGEVTYKDGDVGQIVKKDEVLYEISPSRTSKNIDIDERVGQSLALRLVALKSLGTAQELQFQNSLVAYAQRESSIKAELNKLTEQVRLQQEKISTSNDMMQKYALLRSSGHVSLVQMNQFRNDYSGQNLELNALQREGIAIERELSKLHAERESANSQVLVTRAQLADTVEALNLQILEQTNRSSSQVRATVSGEITTQAIQFGQLVGSGIKMATILPTDSKIIARLYIPSAAVGAAKIGARVKIRLAAYPYQRFGYLHGRLTVIERSPVTLDEATQRVQSDTFYRADVELESIPVGRKLRPGMVLEADVSQGQRSIAQWVMASSSNSAKTN